MANIYVVFQNGAIYKCLAGENEFKEMTGIIDLIFGLTIDNNNNIYVLTNIGNIFISEVN